MSDSSRPPRQRLDTHVRRQSILEAASEEFQLRAFAQVRVSDIAARAGASTALVFRYFGTKAQLYAEVMQVGANRLIALQRQAAEALPQGVPTRDRIRAALLTYFDFVAATPVAWSNAYVSGDEPAEALAVRAQTHEAQVELLHDLLATTKGWPRHAYALRGHWWFVDGVCLEWVRRGCPDEERHPAIDAALGALQGALGDWGG